MKKSMLLTSLAGATLLLVGCGGDKKVEDRVTEIQKNDTNSVAPANTAATNVVKAATASSSPEEGKQVYVTRCVACHGEKGEGKATYPKLAGNTKDEALGKLKGYVDGTYGKAQKAIMAGQAKGLSDAQRAAVAEYIATLK